MSEPGNAILLVSCDDQPGIVAGVTQFLYERGANILHCDQHTEAGGTFYMRVEWQLENFSVEPDDLHAAIAELAERFAMQWELYRTAQRPRLALMASKQMHCLWDLLLRWRGGELDVDIPLVVSNHAQAGEVAAHFDVRFEHVPVTKDSKPRAEERLLALLSEHRADFVVLARYMQILSSKVVDRFAHQIINVHHSFLPAFAGGRPYHSAHERGVKLIGATSHYVTEDLDEGPIIDQEVVRVSHRDDVGDMIRKGRDLERVVLSRAVRLHVQRRVLVHGNKTIVFD